MGVGAGSLQDVTGLSALRRLWARQPAIGADGSGGPPQG
jgi:hypothetical protein